MSSPSNSGGIGLVGATTLVFVVLKLLHVISWSWWWVLSPALFSLGVGLLALALVMLMAVFMKKPRKQTYIRKGKRISG